MKILEYSHVASLYHVNLKFDELLEMMDFQRKMENFFKKSDYSLQLSSRPSLVNLDAQPVNYCYGIITFFDESTFTLFLLKYS